VTGSAAIGVPAYAIDEQTAIKVVSNVRVCRNALGLCGRLLQEVALVAVVEVDLAQHRTCAQHRLNLPKLLDLIQGKFS
jgi:hypothetical protein